MGEYAKFNGEEIKIGTCEDMYYLRHDQRGKVQALRGNVDPIGDRLALRFRFPWPDEDLIEPGSSVFHDNGYYRAIPLHGCDLSFDEHHTVQFSAHAGYLVSLPCPEGPGGLSYGGATIHRNGFAGRVLLVQQKELADGRLVAIVKCGGCDALRRVEDLHEAEAMAVALRKEGDRRDGGRPAFWHAIADRLLAGYANGDTGSALARYA